MQDSNGSSVVIHNKHIIEQNPLIQAYQTTPFTKNKDTEFYPAVYCGAMKLWAGTIDLDWTECKEVMLKHNALHWEGRFYQDGKPGLYLTPNLWNLERIQKLIKSADGDKTQFNWYTRKGTRDTDIGWLCSVFMEIDGKPKVEQLQNIWLLHLDDVALPNTLVDSGDNREIHLRGGYRDIYHGKSTHATWSIFPLPATSENIAKWKEAQKMLIVLLEADTKIHNTGRLMRVGGIATRKAGKILLCHPRVQTCYWSHQTPIHLDTLLDQLQKVLIKRGVDWESRLVELRRIEEQKHKDKRIEEGRETSDRISKRASDKKHTRPSVSGIHRHVESTLDDNLRFDWETQQFCLTDGTITPVKALLEDRTYEDGTISGWCPHHSNTKSRSGYIGVDQDGIPYMGCAGACSQSRFYPQSPKTELDFEWVEVSDKCSPMEGHAGGDVTSKKVPTGTCEDIGLIADAIKPKRKIKSAPTQQAPPFTIKSQTKLLVLPWSMGAGKTYWFENYCKSVKRALGYSPRISLSRQMSKRCGMTCYQDVCQAAIRDDKVIVTINSAGRIVTVENDRTPRPYDVIFFDEPEQSFQALYGDTVGSDSGKIYENLRTQVRMAGLVVLADANISLQSIGLMHRMMGCKKEEIQIAQHHWYDETTKLTSFGDQDHATQAIIEMIDEGKRLAIPCTAKADVKTQAQMIKDKYPNKKVLAIHGESPTEVLETLEDANAEWVKYDVVIYSPCVSSGVDFSVKDHFDYVFLVAKSINGIGWSDLLQQIGRIRHPKENHLFFWIQKKTYKKPVWRKSIKREFETCKADTEAILFREETNQENRQERSPFNEEHFEGWLDMEVIKRIRCRDVLGSFRKYWEDRGFEIQEAKVPDTVALKQTKKKWAEIKKQLKKGDRESILRSPRKSISRAEEDYETNGRQLKDLHTLIFVARKNRYGALVLNEKVLEQDLDKHLWRKTQLLVNYGLWRDGFQQIFFEKDCRDWDTGFDAALRHHTQRAKLIFELVQMIQKHTKWDIDGHLEFLRLPEIILDIPLNQGITKISFEYGEPLCPKGNMPCQGSPKLALSLKKTTPDKMPKLTQEDLLKTDFVTDVKEILAQYKHHKVLEGTGVYWAKNHEEQPMAFVGIVMKALGLDLKRHRKTINGETQNTRTLAPSQFEFMEDVTYRLNCRMRDGYGSSTHNQAPDEREAALALTDANQKSPLSPNDYEVSSDEVKVEQYRLFKSLYEEGDDLHDISQQAYQLAYYSVCGVSL